MLKTRLFEMFGQITSIPRRVFVMIFLALLTPIAGISAALAGTPAEAFVSDNIQKSLGILNNSQLTPVQRSDQFKNLLLSITDMKRIAVFTLGQYALTTSQGDQDAFTVAFQNYSVAVYHSYLGKYAGQTLKITGSNERAANDFIVTTNMIDPSDHSGQRPLEIDFRVRTDTGKPELTDFSVAGIWLAIEERDQFGSFLNQNHGDIGPLITHLHDVTKQYG
jgi:phospholipid transport system substrate-binding protein